MNARAELSLSIGQCTTLACLLEVNAPKPGNVHRSADFDDLTLNDFVASAVAIGPIMAAAAVNGVGETVLQAVHATQRLSVTNSNLGMALLLAPLACVPRDEPLRAGVARVLSDMNQADAVAVYKAIVVAQPGGLGEVDEMDVRSEPPGDLLAAMRLAAERDLVARQYANDFAEVFDEVVPAMISNRARNVALPHAIVDAQMRLLACHGDSLIARKCGVETSQRAKQFAQRVLDAGTPHDEDYWREVSNLDFWLRSDGHRRNPGTTADLIAAGLFVCLRDELVQPPFG
jgi:triphosphoribosyl-dephospho-CoA synthase